MPLTVGSTWQMLDIFISRTEHNLHTICLILMRLGTSVHHIKLAQSVTCLVTDGKLTADPGVASSILARSHTFVEIDHEIISTVILLPSAESFMKGCCQLQAKVCARLLVNCLFKLAQEKVWLGELTIPQ